MPTTPHEPQPIDPTPDPVAGERPGHPLFPRSEHETGPERRRIDLIHIERMREDGTWETCPKTFKASELRSWKEVVDLYGGGAYRARAQCGKTYQWQGTTERKEFAGPPRPFIETQQRSAPAPTFAAPPHTTPLLSHGPGAPPPNYGPPAWAPPAHQEPPPWLAVLVKALDRPAPPPQDTALVGLMFKTMADQTALIFKMLAERQAPSPAAPAANPLEMIRELKPLLESNTAPGQFMQGIEIAKSLMQQSAPAAPPQEDFATTLAGIMRSFGGGGLLPGLEGPAAPAAPPAPAPPPAPPLPPPVPTMGMDEVITMIAGNRDLTQRFLHELGRRANTTAQGRPAYEPPPPPAAVPPPAPSASSAPAAPVHGLAPSQAGAALGRGEVAAPADRASSGALPARSEDPGRAAPSVPAEDSAHGATVASSGSAPSEADLSVFGSVPQLPAINEAELRAILGTLFEERHEGGGETNPRTGAPMSSTPQDGHDGTAGDVLLALTGRQKGEA